MAGHPPLLTRGFVKLYAWTSDMVALDASSTGNPAAYQRKCCPYWYHCWHPPILPRATCKALWKESPGWKYKGMLEQSVQHNPGSRACLTWLSLHLEEALVHAA